MTNTCLIYNYAQHYRKGVFIKLDNELQCDSYFGDKMGDVNKMDYNLLPHFQKELINIPLIPPFYWQSGAVSLIFKNYKHYILLGEYYCLSTWLILILSKFSSKKVHLWTHGWYGNESFLKRLIKNLFWLADNILLYGEYAKKLMIKEGFNAGKLHVVFNSLDYERQLKERERLSQNSLYGKHFKNDNPTLIFIGRLTKVKKLDMILEAMQTLKSEGIHFNFVFVGEGEEKGKLEKLVKDYQLCSSVWFYGASYDEKEISNLIFNATLCISPGNVGLTAMHSLVYGTPVITHNDFPNQMPEFEAIVAGKSGVFFNRNSLSDMTEKIKFWLLEKTDREKIRIDCFDRIDQFYNPQYQTKVIKNLIN